MTRSSDRKGGARGRRVPHAGGAPGGPSLEARADAEAVVGDLGPCGCGDRRVVTLWAFGRHSWWPYATVCYVCRADRFDWSWWYLVSYLPEVEVDAS
jgi:hypothetical protein